MGIYRRPDSLFWWMLLERPGQRAMRLSTKIPVAGATPQQTAENKQLALAVYTARMGDLARSAHGLVPALETIGFTTYAHWYAAHYSAHKRSRAREASALDGLRKYFGQRLLHTLDAAAVAEWRTFRAAQVKAATVNREFDVLKHLLAVAVPKYLRENPVRSMPRLYAPRPPIRLLSEDEETRLLAVCDPVETALIVVALETMMRLTDVRTLERRHDHGTYLEVVQPKVEPYRVPVTPRVRRVLDALPAAESPYFFPTRHRGKGHRPLSANTVHRLFMGACARAHIPHGRRDQGLTFHSLRHTGASRALDRGANIRAVQELGGWRNLTQLERYAHPTWAAVVDAATKIAARDGHVEGKTPDATEAVQSDTEI